jgi:hypothetical protein
MKQSITMLLFFCLGLMSSVKLYSASPNPLTKEDSLNSEQLIIVLTDHWNSIRAKLFCVEKKGGKWVTQF